MTYGHVVRLLESMLANEAAGDGDEMLQEIYTDFLEREGVVIDIATLCRTIRDHGFSRNRAYLARSKSWLTRARPWAQVPFYRTRLSRMVGICKLTAALWAPFALGPTLSDGGVASCSGLLHVPVSHVLLFLVDVDLAIDSS